MNNLYQGNTPSQVTARPALLAQFKLMAIFAGTLLFSSYLSQPTAELVMQVKQISDKGAVEVDMIANRKKSGRGSAEMPIDPTYICRVEPWNCLRVL